MRTVWNVYFELPHLRRAMVPRTREEVDESQRNRCLSDQKTGPPMVNGPRNLSPAVQPPTQCPPHPPHGLEPHGTIPRGPPTAVAATIAAISPPTGCTIGGGHSGGHRGRQQESHPQPAWRVHPPRLQVSHPQSGWRVHPPRLQVSHPQSGWRVHELRRPHEPHPQSGLRVQQLVRVDTTITGLHTPMRGGLQMGISRMSLMLRMAAMGVRMPAASPPP